MDRIESDPTPAGEPIDPASPQDDVIPERTLWSQPPVDEESGPPTPPPPSRRHINPVLELALILLAALGLWWVANGWIVKPYRIPSASMEPTLRDGDRVLVARFIYHLHDPRRGDIIVFHPPGAGTTRSTPRPRPASTSSSGSSACPVRRSRGATITC